MSGADERGARDVVAPSRLRENRIGIWTAALDALDPAQAGQQARQLESLGYASLWFGEAYGREAFTTAGLLLGATENLVVGTGIANIFGRDAVTGNAASRTLQAAYPGRFVSGWGVSHQSIVERMRGHTYTPPLAAMREYLEALDDAPFAASGPKTGPARLLAALRPKMLTLASTNADGAHTYLVTPEHTRLARAALGPDRLLCVEQAVVVGTDRVTFLRRAHWHLEIYTGLPNYRASWSAQGFDEQDYVRGGSVRLKESLVAWGDENAIGHRVKQHFDAGADHVLLQVLGEHPFDVPAQGWSDLAPLILRDY